MAAIDEAEQIALGFLPDALPRLPELILRHRSSGVCTHGHSDDLGAVGSCRHGDRRIDLGPHDVAQPERQARAEQIRHDLGRREDLVRDFIVAASKTYGEALVTSEPRAPDLVNLYSMVRRMRVFAMPRSVASAEKLMLVIIDTYFQPNKTIRDLHEMMKTRGGVDPLWEFSDAARHGT